MHTPQPDEIRIELPWKNETPVDSQVLSRIQWLLREHFNKVAVDETGWEILYRDPTDGRYWECTYPYGAYHGGGPVRLQVMSEENARKKYHLGG